jgi:hypothetical protein
LLSSGIRNPADSRSKTIARNTIFPKTRITTGFEKAGVPHCRQQTSLLEVTNLRIKYSEFSKRTAKTEDVPLDTLASCSETRDQPRIELLFVIGDTEAVQSIRCLTFSKADENAMLLTQLPCPRQEDLKQILESRYI